MSAPRLLVRNFAQVREADVRFGDLTLLVGPQATGKSILSQMLKLAVDGPRIADELMRNGFEWRDRGQFCDVYFGEGMKGAWTNSTSVEFGERAVRVPPRRASGDPHLFYIPAHRALSIANGWPLGFRSYSADTPFVVRDFSERLLELLTTKRGIEGNLVFPQERRLKGAFRKLIDEAVFHGGELKLESEGTRRQFKLVYPGTETANMAWSAGQREFIPLLLGIYHLLPLGKNRRTTPIKWVVIEEPEMGLHVEALKAVMLLFLELMDRGYRLVISTHSLAVLEVTWAFQQLKGSGAEPQKLLEMFGIDAKRWDITDLARKTMKKSFRVYHLGYANDGMVQSREISKLDPAAHSREERSWGGLLSPSTQANQVVAENAADGS